MFTLRNYQKEGIEACKKVLLAKKRKALVVAPTGAGKSIYIAKTTHDLDVPMVILQPSKELLVQNYKKFTAYGGKATIYCSSLKEKSIDKKGYFKLNGEYKRCDEVSRVTFATVGSIKKEIVKLKKIGVKHICIDEAHLQTKVGSQTRKFMKDLKVTNVLGLTATPIYLKGGMDGSRLVMINRDFGTIFRNIDHVTQIKEVTDEKFWAPFIYKIINNDESSLRLNSSGADYTEHSQKEYYKSNDLKGRIVEEVKKLKEEGRKRILIFVPSIEEANELYGSIPNSAVVHSKMNTKERDFMIDAFTNGDIPVAINVNVLAVGYDNPEIDAIITSRPTSSVAVFYQQIGRGCRIHPEKENCTITDFSGNTKRFGRVEELTFEKIPFYGWGMYNGKGEVLTDYPIQTTRKPTKESLIASYKIEEEEQIEKAKDTTPEFYFGKHNGKKVAQVLKEDKGYLVWICDQENFNWNGVKGEMLKTAIYKALRLPIPQSKKEESTTPVKKYSGNVNLNNINTIF